MTVTTPVQRSDEETDEAIRASFEVTMQTPAETQRLAERASLRSHTRSLLRGLNAEYDRSIGVAAHAVVALRMRCVRDELAAALRGDPRAIGSLTSDRNDPAAH